MERGVSGGEMAEEGECAVSIHHAEEQKWRCFPMGHPHPLPLRLLSQCHTVCCQQENEIRMAQCQCVRRGRDKANVLSEGETSLITRQRVRAFSPACCVRCVWWREASRLHDCLSAEQQGGVLSTERAVWSGGVLPSEATSRVSSYIIIPLFC